MGDLYSRRFSYNGLSYLIREVAWFEQRHYDSWVKTQKMGNPFQTMAWGRFKAQGAWEALPLHLETGGEIKASAMILCRTGAGLSFFYSPRGPVLDYSDPQVFGAMCRGITLLAAQRGTVFWRLDPELYTISPSLKELEPVDSPSPFGGVQPRWVWRIGLKATVAEQWGELKKGARRQIRRAERAGIILRDVKAAEITFLHRLFCATARRNGFSQRPLEYFRMLWQQYSPGGHIKAAIAWLGDRPLSGALAVSFGEGVWDLYAGNATRDDDHGACYLLTWQMISWACRQGYRFYDLGGVADPEGDDQGLRGLELFKSRFGGSRVGYVGEHDLVFRPLLYKGLLFAEQGWQALRTRAKKKID